MSFLNSLLAGALPAIVGPFVLYALKASVILALTLATTSLMHGAAPLKRNLVLRIATVAVFMLPLIMIFGPVWNVGTFSSVTSALHIYGPTISAAGADTAGTVTDTVPGVPWAAWLFVAWLTGAAVVVSRILIGAALSMAVIRSARPAGMRLNELAKRFSEVIGTGRKVRVMLSRSISMPFVVGVFRPVIVLPESAEQWPERNLRMVLLHELAHIKRHDIVWTILGSFASAIHWFNPLVWIVRKQLLIEAEKTCDDFVINAGTGPVVYAEHLLTVAREMGGRRLVYPLGAGMARKTELEGRLMSVLSKRMRSVGAGKPLVALILLLSASIIVPLACLGGTAKASDNPAVTIDDQSTKTSSDDYLPSVDEFVPVEIYPEMIKQTKPEYPKAAEDAGIGGVVWVQALVDKKGKVRKVKVARSSGHKELDDSAVKAAWLNEFSPAIQDGKPVAVWVTYKVEFSVAEKTSIK